MQLKPYKTSILLAIFFLFIVSAFWMLPSLAFIAFISLLLQLFLQPLVDKLSMRISRGLASGIVLVACLSLSLGGLVIISSTFLPNAMKFLADLPEITKEIQNMEFLQDSAILTDELNNLWGEIMSASMDALKSSLGLLLSLFNKFIDFVIIIFVTFYLLKDGEQIKEFAANLFPKENHWRVMQLFNRILSALRIYVCSQLCICCLSGIVVFSYFSLRDMPYASVFAVISGIAEFIPVLGPTLASAFAVLMTTTQSVPLAVQTAGFYLILTQINHNIVYPTLIGKSLNLHPIAIILGVVLGGEILGAAGMFLAVPVIVVCKLLIEDIVQDKKNKSEA